MHFHAFLTLLLKVTHSAPKQKIYLHNHHLNEASSAAFNNGKLTSQTAQITYA